jgi:hypothetical protein
LWEVARQTPNVRAVFLEACFPNSMKWLAEAAVHMTPEIFGQEAAKIPAGTRIIAVQIKVRYREQIIRELNELHFWNLELGECGKEYRF